MSAMCRITWFSSRMPLPPSRLRASAMTSRALVVLLSLPTEAMVSDGRDAQVAQADVRLPDRAERALAADHGGLVPGRRRLHEEALDLPVLGVARPEDDDVGDGAVADPALGAVDHVLVPAPLGAGLQGDGVGAVVGLGEGEGAEALGPGHRRQPALLLLLGAEHGDRAHRQPRLDAEEGAQAAVAAVELHVHEPGG